MTRQAISVTSILLAAACTNVASVKPDLAQIVRTEIAAVVAIDPSIRCNSNTADVLIGFDCFQTFAPTDDRHFAALSVQVKRAQGTLAGDASRLMNVTFGPGGGGSLYKGRTRDGTYDVLATELQSLRDGQQLLLPQAGELIDKVLATYDGAKTPPK